jgi:2-phosphoglycerate kinase
MSKIIIKNTEGMETPFLRGILTSSLIDAGIEFHLAYDLASDIRHILNNKGEVKTQELREIIISLLEKKSNKEVVERFQSNTNTSSAIMVSNHDGTLTPFSRGEHRLYIESCGLSNDDSSNITTIIYNDLLNRGFTKLSSNELGRMTYDVLFSEISEKVAERFLVWSDYLRSGRPLILLIGGAAGVGKSTIATEVGHRFGIVRSQSTDMLREVMRMMTPERLSPVLHASSYNAWKVQPGVTPDTPMSPELMLAGFLHQTELLSVACEAIINRAMHEKVSLIMEGVHIHPNLLEIIEKSQENSFADCAHDNNFSDPDAHTDTKRHNQCAIIVPIMLSVLKAGKLKEHIKGRGQDVPERRSNRYLNHFPEIWELQSHLMAEADRCNVPIVSNINRDKAIQEVMRTINNILHPYFSHDIDKVFPV